MMQDVFVVSLSQGNVRNLQKRCHDKLEGFEQAAKEQRINCAVAHFDETGMRVDKQLHWMHVACTDSLRLSPRLTDIARRARRNPHLA